MKRGADTRSRSAATAGLKRSRWPTWRTSPRDSASSTSSFACADGRGHRLLDEHVRAVREKVLRDLVMQRRRHRDAHRVDAARAARDSPRRRAAVRVRDPLAMLGVGVRDRDQLRAVEAASFSAWNLPRYPTPTTAVLSIRSSELARSISPGADRGLWLETGRRSRLAAPDVRREAAIVADEARGLERREMRRLAHRHVVDGLDREEPRSRAARQSMQRAERDRQRRSASAVAKVRS